MSVGDAEIELHPTAGHTADGVAFTVNAVLACGDYLSDVEIPMISPGGAITDYRATLARLAPLVESAEAVVPGHGAPHDRERSLRILDEDLEYLVGLSRGEVKPRLPAGRETGRQRAIHAENLAQTGPR
jgi:glyoxylase-like metal-dependent hydrolase (beta-lactamase superfamily II)